MLKIINNGKLAYIQASIKCMSLLKYILNLLNRKMMGFWRSTLLICSVLLEGWQNEKENEEVGGLTVITKSILELFSTITSHLKHGRC